MQPVSRVYNSQKRQALMHKRQVLMRKRDICCGHTYTTCVSTQHYSATQESELPVNCFNYYQNLFLYFESQLVYI